MQIVPTDDNLPEMSKPVFWGKKEEKKKNISVCCLLKMLLPRVLSVNEPFRAETTLWHIRQQRYRSVLACIQSDHGLRCQFIYRVFISQYTMVVTLVGSDQTAWVRGQIRVCACRIRHIIVFYLDTQQCCHMKCLRETEAPISFFMCYLFQGKPLQKIF